MKLPVFSEFSCPDDNEKFVLKWRNLGKGRKVPYYLCLGCGCTKKPEEVGIKIEKEVKPKKSPKFCNYLMINGRMVEIDRFGHPIEEKEE